MDELTRIVAIEDDETIRGILRMMLKSAGFPHLQVAARGDEGLELVRRTRPDLVILDLMLPGLDGLSVCRRIRETPELAATRIVMLTAKSEDEDVVKGLELGADDYVTKPFSRSVLLARIRAVIRRGDVFTAGRALDGLVIDAAGRSARLGETVLMLTRAEFLMLELLASRPGRIYTRAQILEAVQGDDSESTERTVDVQMVSLRRKLGPWAKHIETVRGVGYRVLP